LAGPRAPLYLVPTEGGIQAISTSSPVWTAAFAAGRLNGGSSKDCRRFVRLNCSKKGTRPIGRRALSPRPCLTRRRRGRGLFGLWSGKTRLLFGHETGGISRLIFFQINSKALSKRHTRIAPANRPPPTSFSPFSSSFAKGRSPTAAQPL